jgi:hypothetical protein
VELIENRGIQLGSLCTAHKEESLRISQAVRNFIEQYESVNLNKNLIKLFNCNEIKINSFNSCNRGCWT